MPGCEKTSRASAGRWRSSSSGAAIQPHLQDQPAAGSYVLRRKPLGKLLPSAHAVDREYRVSPRCRTGFPVRALRALPRRRRHRLRLLHHVHVEGRVFWDRPCPAHSGATGRRLRSEKSYARPFHKYDAEKIGLADFGKPGNYFARQIDRWTKQYRASETKVIAAMDRLIAWLPTTVPPQDRVTVVHGDYRIDNMIFHPTEPRVAAVLDWELSTLGDPLADFTYLLMNWALQAEGRSGLHGLDLPALGIPTMAETTALYCEHTGRAAFRRSTGISPTTCSGSRRFRKGSPSALSRARPPTSARGRLPNVPRRLPRRRGSMLKRPGPNLNLRRCRERAGGR